MVADPETVQDTTTPLHVDRDVEVDFSMYKKLADSIHPPYQSPSVLLDCMVEQVGATIRSESAGVAIVGGEECKRYEARKLSEYIEAIAQDWGVSKEDKKSDTDDSDTNPYHHLEDTVLPSLDDLKCRFRGVEMFGHERVDAVAKRVDHCFRIPDTPTVGQSEPLTADQRRALRTKIIPFMPKRLSRASIERLLLLTEFAKLMNSVTPVKKGHVGDCSLASLIDRTVCEKIPIGLLRQRLGALIYGRAAAEPYLVTRYWSRYDATLIAIYYPTPPGRMCMHTWREEVEVGEKEEEEESMQEENEVDADGQAAEDPNADLQASKGPQYEIREAVEKCYVPADGSVIISTRFTRTSAIGKTPVDCDAGAEEKAMEEETLVAGEEGNDDDIQHEDEFNRELICSRRVAKAFVKGCTLRVGESYVSCVFEDSSRFTVTREGENGFVLMYTPLKATWVTLCPHQGIELKPQKVTFEKPLMRMVPNARCGDLVCDVETSRRVFPKGVIMRELTSGRKELFYPDGTFSYRDPTPEELAGSFHLLVDSRPGMWIVIKPRSGEMYRRWNCPQRPEPLSQVVGEGEEEQTKVDAEFQAAEKRYSDEIKCLVEGGMCEEELDTKVPTATQVDPDSGDEIVTNNLGTMIITTRDGSTRTVVFPDHTRIITERLGGQEERITISKLGTPLCSISRTDSSEMCVISLEDSSKISVEFDGEEKRVTVERPDTREAIEIDAITGKTVVVGTPYVSEFIEHADDGGSFMLRCVDNERNSFEIDGRTNRCSVRLATSLGESKDMPSPRPGAPLAEVPPSMTALYHADKDFLPAVDGLSSHPPRLIVIYGDGISEAQEILPSREAREALNASDLIKESVPMDLPMDGCTSHYLIRTGCSVDLKTLPIPHISIPPCVSRQVEAVEEPNPVVTRPNEFTTVRHLIEYPEVDHKLMHEFEDACTRYDEWMEAHRGLHDELAARMQREAEAKAAEKTNKRKNTKS